MNAPKITFVVEMVQKGKENRILKTGVMSPTPRFEIQNVAAYLNILSLGMFSTYVQRPTLCFCRDQSYK